VDGEATIYVSRIDTIERETARCGVVDILQFKGFYTDLEGVLTQAGFQHLVKACKVAFRKTNCVDCEKPHFCQVRGPDGVWEDVVRVNDNKAPVLFNELEV
jgi:hypothetical protein